MTSLAYAALWVFVFAMPWEKHSRAPRARASSRGSRAGPRSALTVLAVVLAGRIRRWHSSTSRRCSFWIWAAIELMLFHSADPGLPDKFWTYGQLILVLWMIWELAPSAEPAARAADLAYRARRLRRRRWTPSGCIRRDAGALRRFAAGGARPQRPGDGARPGAADGVVSRDDLPPAAAALDLPRLHARSACSPSASPAPAVACWRRPSRSLIVPLSMTQLSPGRIVDGRRDARRSPAPSPSPTSRRPSSNGSPPPRPRCKAGTLRRPRQVWRAGLEVFPRAPGVRLWHGRLQVGDHARARADGAVAHNSYLSVLVEQGIVGFLLYMSMFVAVFVSVLRLPRLERRFGLVLLAPSGWRCSR